MTLILRGRGPGEVRLACTGARWCRSPQGHELGGQRHRTLRTLGSGQLPELTKAKITAIRGLIVARSGAWVKAIDAACGLGKPRLPARPPGQRVRRAGTAVHGIRRGQMGLRRNGAAACSA